MNLFTLLLKLSTLVAITVSYDNKFLVMPLHAGLPYRVMQTLVMPRWPLVPSIQEKDILFRTFQHGKSLLKEHIKLCMMWREKFFSLFHNIESEAV